MICRPFLAIALLLTPVGASAQADLARDTAKVEDLTAIRQIKHMQARWGHMAMAGNWKGMAEMAAPDAEIETRGGIITGRGGLESWLRTVQGHGVDGMQARQMNVRLFMSPVITLADDGQSATGRWHEVAMTAEVGKEAGWQGATHVIEYRKSADGWQISHIRPYAHFAGSYEDGWSHRADELERAPYHYTTDGAGVILPDRRAASVMQADAISRQANVLLAEGLAQNTVNAYGFYLDRGMYDDIADLFADDATIEMGGIGSWSGKDGVRKFLTRFGAPGLDEGELNDRAQLMPMINIAEDGSMALVRNIEVGMTGQHGGEGFWQVTMQTFMLRPDEDGHWRIALMHRSPIMRSNYEDGWARPLPAALPMQAGGEPTGETRLGSIDFREAAYAIPPLGLSIFMPARGEPANMPQDPQALAKAEAFDGAENVSNAYGYYIDQFAWRETTEVFSRQGWKELSYIGTFIGRDRLMSSLIQRYGNGGPSNAFQAIHQKVQPVVTVYDGGERAFIRERLFQFNSGTPGAASWTTGIYENQIVKEDGIWRIAGMDLDYNWTGSYNTGWTGIDPAAAAASAPPLDAVAAFAPDGPLRGERTAPYPRIAPMGFHYANPVSGREPDLRLQWNDGPRF